MSLLTCGLPILFPLALAFTIPDRTRVLIMDNSVSGGGYDCLHGLYPKRLGRHGSRPYGFTNNDMPLKTKTYYMHLFSKQKCTNCRGGYQPPAPESAELFPKKVENVPLYVIQALSVSGVEESTT